MESVSYRLKIESTRLPPMAQAEVAMIVGGRKSKGRTVELFECRRVCPLGRVRNVDRQRASRCDVKEDWTGRDPLRYAEAKSRLSKQCFGQSGTIDQLKSRQVITKLTSRMRPSAVSQALMIETLAPFFVVLVSSSIAVLSAPSDSHKLCKEIPFSSAASVTLHNLANVSLPGGTRPERNSAGNQPDPCQAVSNRSLLVSRRWR